MEQALEAGAEDIELNDDGSMDVITPWEQFIAVKQALEESGLVAEDGEVTMIAATTVELDAGGADSIMGLVDSLEDLDDVQNVYTNADIPEAVLATLV
jgi:transcriptional/translational regulatory protein YebC/TACO1